MPPNSQAALQQLQSYQSGAQSPEQLITNAQNKLGVGAAQQQVSGLRGAINNTTNLLQQVAPSVMGRTGNSLVTSAQADKIIGNEQAPIQQNLSKDTQDYNDANATYTDLENQAEQRANADLTGQQNQESYLQGIYNDLYTQEQNASQQAEAKREFDVGQQTSRSNAALSTSPKDTPADYNNSSVQNWVDAIKSEYGDNLSSEGWGNVAKALESQYGTIPTGSNADQALHYIFTGQY